MKPAPTPNDPVPSGCEFDEAHVRSIFGDDTEAVIELIDLVLTDLPRHGSSLTVQVNNEQWNEAARTAHSMKGAASNLGASRVTEAARLVEDAVRRQDFAAVRSHVRQLHQAMDSLVAALTKWKRLAAPRKDVA